MPRKVLLADDSVTAQNMGRRILVDAGYEVITVNNGSSALKKVSESKPDLIVLDVYMPGYGGLEVCQRIRESSETARIPVLLTVGKLEPFKAEEARKVRADAFIVKPFEASELLTALTKLEDKIVPQPSGRKGRSGRSSADEEAAARKEFGDVEGGWKNRLKIPPPHHPRAQAAASHSDSELSSEVPSPIAAENQQAAKPEEPAAVATAKSQLPEAERPNSEFDMRADESANQTSTALSETRDAVNGPAEAALPQAAQTESSVPEVTQDARDDGAKEKRSSHEEEVAAALASLAPNVDASGTTAFEPAPVTMAAAVADQEYSGPRWIAQEVALSDDESSLILEEEMHKAFAAFAAADAARMNVSSSSEPHQESSTPQQGEAAVASASVSMHSAISDGASFAAVTETRDQISSVAINPPAALGSENEVEGAKQTAAYAAAAGAGNGSGSAETNADAVSQPVPPEAPASESRHDAELASAWASWKQVRGSVSDPEFTSQIAEAATTGFKEIRHEQPATPAESESAPAAAEENGAIASIVDSVLAELKPKLMEEIAKKMKKEK
ncbi:MAG TPA: response regulator [Terriglobales bacterium]|nr:response regulator [Terriglobales bacterium]